VALVVNKIDDPKHENLATDFDSLGFGASVSISAAHGRGIIDLIETIEQLLPAKADHSPVISQNSPAIAIAIVGRPNVGKSSIINAITRTERAIVSELPGTTRDAVDISYRNNGDEFVFIDTAGIRRRGKHSSSVEVFSVMRSEKSIRRANLCILAVDVTSGVTAQDKKIAGLIQEARKPAIVLVNKFDLLKNRASSRQLIEEVTEDVRQRLFFLDYAPVLVTSALTGAHVDKVFRLIHKVERAASQRIGTGKLNRLLRAAFDANPPPMVSGRRLKLLYATQPADSKEIGAIYPPEFVLFVNDPKLLGQTYRRYLEAQIRAGCPYPGLPILLTLRPRTESQKRAAHGRPR
jgi:GTP-binding protein